MKKSFVTRALAVSLSAAMAFSLSSATSLTAPEAAAKKLAANAKAAKISLKVGKSKTLQLKSYKTWNISKAKSNKTGVAAVKKSGTNAKVKVTAKKAGKATITLTLKHKKGLKKNITKKINVTVKKAATTDTTPTDTTPTDTTPTTTDSAVKVTPGALNITEVKATKADTLVVSFSSVVASTGAVKLSVVRGETTNVDQEKVEWNADATSVTITMASKMTKGTYTVTATDGKDTTKGSTEVKDQEVTDILFLNETALTGTYQGKDAAAAYIYYKVVDQYGESMNETTSVQWTPSTGTSGMTVDRAKGRITLTKNNGSNDNTFTFGEKIYVTGVYTKTGITASSEFTVGTAQSVDSIEMLGFLKKGSKTIEKSLPSNVKNYEYYVVYDAFDQNGNPLDAANYAKNTNLKTGGLTFVSDNVLVIKDVEPLSGGDSATINVDGREYCAAWIVPGTNVNDGGTVNLSAISNKTGKKSTLNFVVGAYKILRSFEIGLPSDVVADGEEAELSFTALDEEGNKMTNFRELADQTTFSELRLSASVGELKLSENDDGSAKLVWKDNGAESVWRAGSEDGVDRMVALTGIVVGGQTSNQMLQVSDKAYPTEIANVKVDPVYVDGKEQKFSLSSFDFRDQYGRLMKATYKNGNKIYTDVDYDTYRASYNTRVFDDGSNDGYVYDNGFFEFVNGNNGGITDTDFNGYTFFVGINASNNFTAASSSAITYATARKAQVVSASAADVYNAKLTKVVDANEAAAAGFVIDYDDSKSADDATLTFVIAKSKPSEAGTKTDVISKKKTATVKVVSIDDLSNFTVDDIDKLQIYTKASNYKNYESMEGGAHASSLSNTIGWDSTRNYDGGTDLKLESTKDVKVKATYNGNSVELPDTYYRVKGDVVRTKNEDQYGNKALVAVKKDSLKWSNLYDVSTAHYERKDANDTLKVTVANQEGSKPGAGTAATIEKTVYISDANATPTTFTAADRVTIAPENTRYTVSKLIDGGKLADAAADKKVVIKDQYNNELYLWNDALASNEKLAKGKTINGAPVTATFKYLVKDVVEATDELVHNSITISDNSTANAKIEGLERGDKFTVVITATINGEDISKSVAVTVGADDYSLITSNGNQNKYTMTNGLKATLQGILQKLNK